MAMILHGLSKHLLPQQWCPKNWNRKALWYELFKYENSQNKNKYIYDNNKKQLQKKEHGHEGNISNEKNMKVCIHTNMDKTFN